MNKKNFYQNYVTLINLEKNRFSPILRKKYNKLNKKYTKLKNKGLKINIWWRKMKLQN